MELGQIIKKVVKISGITILSRILGYVRDIIVAAHIGTGFLNDVFIATFKIANLFRAVFAEGAFNAAFVPLFVDSMAKNGKQSAMQFASEAQSLLTVILCILTIVMIVFMPIVITITTPGFAKTQYAFDLAVYLGRISFPYIIFISLAALYGGILNSFGVFSPFAATSIILNIVMIISALMDKYTPTAAHALTYGTLIAGVLEFLWMLFFLRKYKLLLLLCRPRITPIIRRMIKVMVPSIMSFGIMQVNILVSMMVVSLVQDGMSYVYYADRVVQLPIALISTAMGTVILPVLSRAFELKQRSDIEKIVYDSLSLVLFFAIPAMFATLYLAKDIVQVLFMRGSFSALSVKNTASALVALSVGIPAFCVNRLFTTIFYSHQNTSVPMKISILTMLVNVFVSVALLGSMRHVGVSIASSLAGWSNVLCSAVLLKKYYAFDMMWNTLKKEVLKFIFSSVCMIGIIHVTCMILYTICSSLFLLLCNVLLGLLSYFFMCYVVKSETYSMLRRGKDFGVVNEKVKVA